MLLSWLTSMLLLVQPVPVNTPDSISLVQQGQTIAIIQRKDFTVPLPGTPVLDTEKLKVFTDKLEGQVYRPPINARINDTGGISSGQNGSKLYREAFKEKFYAKFFSKGPSKIEIPSLTVHPRVDSELLGNIRTNHLGQYVTYFNRSNTSRIHNISLAANAIDNHVVFPGETFSFNRVVGNRTKEKGYMRAPVIIRGELSEGVGGGICQVSSTLFNAVDRAGLHIVQRYSHTRRVPYVPKGRDATVSWYGPDFRFQNRYNQPILIRAKAYGGSIMVMVSSSDVINLPQKKS
ncbi:VanW family protein [Fictibacillus enclensis]|uniref:VanW family protein n=1 Tax=Fictibacillus enclensis TaxID=1017270 RepID=UPI0025A2FD0E|nr:VanW family protein [Fictibacillus enclensis]MDM5337169.1 VanW family protein [Fictibacillus enclensis]